LPIFVESTGFAGDPECMNMASTQNRSLLLNASFEPMRIISWQKALILWFQGKVEIIEYHSIFARSVSSSFQLPSVMKLKSYVRPRTLGPVRFCRENVYIRDKYECQYCGEKHPLKDLTLDHVVPASKKGPKSWINVVTACRECNQRKGNRTPNLANMPLLSLPKVPHWLPSLELECSADSMPGSWQQYLQYQAG
jgi:5-methylcytosine-specific restriction endonuclease McrA